MKLTERVYLAGSGRNGLEMTDPLDCHVYLVDGGSAWALVDAGGGGDVDGILANIEDDGFDPTAIDWLFLTHTHADHAAGAAEIRRRTGCRVAVVEALAASLADGDEKAISLGEAKAAGIYPNDFVFTACPVDRELADGETIGLGDLTVEVLVTPGHSLADTCFLLTGADRRDLFVGDTVFAGGRILLQNIYDCDHHACARSIERLSRLSIDGLFPGHGLVSINAGARHIAEAKATFDRLLVPPQLL